MVALRELTAKLGFDVDLSGVNRFDKSIDSSKRKVEGFNLINLGGFRNIVSKALVFAGAGFATIAAGAASAFKFADVKAGLNDLEQSSKGSFGAIKGSIDEILADKTIGNLVKELDLVNAAAIHARDGLDPGVIADLLAPATLFAINARKSTSEIFAGISSFIESGSLDILRQTGKLNQAQIELLKAAGVGPGQAGLVARTEKIRQVFFGLEGELRARTQKIVESGALTARELTGAFDKLVLEVGERTLPAFKSLNDELIPFIEQLTRFVGGEIGVREILKAKPGSPREKKQKVFAEELKSQAQVTFDFFNFLIPSLDRANQAIGDINQEQRGQLIPSISGATPIVPASGSTTNRATTQSTSQRTNVNVTNNVTVQPGANVSPGMIGAEIEKANRRTLGNVKELNERATIKRGG